MSPELHRSLLEDSGRVRNLARWLVRDADSADEVVQRAWVAALERPPADTSRLSGWFRTVVTNQARRLGRDQKRRERIERSLEETRRPQGSPDELFERAVLHRHVVDRVLELPKHYRVVILLRFFEGLENREIADILSPLLVASFHFDRGKRSLVRRLLVEVLENGEYDAQGNCSWAARRRDVLRRR